MRRITIILVLGLVFWLTPALTGTAGASASNPTTYGQASNGAIASTETYQANQGTPIDSAGVSCLHKANNDSAASVPAGQALLTTEYDLYLADIEMSGAGEPCNQGPGAPMNTPANVTSGAAEGVNQGTVAGTAQLTSGTYLNAPGCTGGPYNRWWNIDGYTASDWMLVQWVGYGCWAGETSSFPQCAPGDTAPGYSVTQNACYTVKNPSPYLVVTRDNFTVHFQVLWIQEQWTYQYWMNQLTNGTTQTGCGIGC